MCFTMTFTLDTLRATTALNDSLRPGAPIAHRSCGLKPPRGAMSGMKRKNGLRGQRNLLKRLDPDKRIQGNPSLFLLIFFACLVAILLDLAKFGFGLEHEIGDRR
jgi:hypothetical protein